MTLHSHINKHLTAKQAEQFNNHLNTINLNCKLFGIVPHDMIDVMMMGLGLSISDYNRSAPKLSEEDKGALYARLFCKFLSKSSPFLTIDLGNTSLYFNRDKRIMSITGYYDDSMYEKNYNFNDVKRELLPLLTTALNDVSQLGRINRCLDNNVFVVCMEHDLKNDCIKMKCSGESPFLVTRKQLQEVVNIITEVC